MRCCLMMLPCDITRVWVHAAQPVKPFPLLSLSQSVFLLEASSSAQIAAVVEHVVAVRVQCPVAALSRLLVVTSDLDETLVQRQVVSD